LQWQKGGFMPEQSTTNLVDYQRINLLDQVRQLLLEKMKLAWQTQNLAAFALFADTYRKMVG
jgi:hypothetical protein